jgi:hypothetical protein
MVGIGLKKKPGLFCLSRGELLPAERAAVQARRCTTDEQVRPVALERHLCSNGAAQTADGRVRAEEPCPPRKPLVESVHTTSVVHAANVAVNFPKGE